MAILSLLDLPIIVIGRPEMLDPDRQSSRELLNTRRNAPRCLAVDLDDGAVRYDIEQRFDFDPAAALHLDARQAHMGAAVDQVEIEDHAELPSGAIDEEVDLAVV